MSSLTAYRVTRHDPCRVCGKPDWCINAPEGTICQRIESEHKSGEAGWWHPLEGRRKELAPSGTNYSSLLSSESKSPKLAPATYGSHKPSQIYFYNLADGSPAYRKLRFEKGTLDPDRKQFRFEHWRDGAWYCGRGNYAPSLYRLEQFKGRKTVYVVEGEKCADALWDFGLLGTCDDSGGRSWHKSLNLHFINKHIVVLPDNDQTGRDFIAMIRKNLLPVANSMRVVDLPGLPDKGDIADWLEAVA